MKYRASGICDHSCRPMSSNLLAAVVHADGVHPRRLIGHAIARLRRQGTALAGVIDLESTGAAGSHVAKRWLKNLATGEVLTIADFDVAVLNELALGIAQMMHADPSHLLVVSNFGRVEAAGGGMRRAIRAAIDLGIPALVAVPAANLESWRAFAGPLAVEMPPEMPAIEEWLRAQGLLAPAALPPGARQPSGLEKRNVT